MLTNSESHKAEREQAKIINYCLSATYETHASPGTRHVYNLSMNTLPVLLACGPNIQPAFVYGFLGVAGLVLLSFIWGAVSLFTGGIKLGVGLISFSAAVTAGFLMLIRFL